MIKEGGYTIILYDIYLKRHGGHTFCMQDFHLRAFIMRTVAIVKIKEKNTKT